MTRQMQKLKQVHRHDPDNGKHGDCYRTCIAMILGLKAFEVPHFYDKGATDGTDRARDWLAERGFRYIVTAFHGDTPLRAMKDVMATNWPGIPCIVTGKGHNGVNHAVVFLDGKIHCDPSTGTAKREPFTAPGDCDEGQFWWVEAIVGSPLEVKETT